MDLFGIARVILGGLFTGKGIKVKELDGAALKFAELAAEQVDKEVEDRVSARVLAEKDALHGTKFTKILSATHRPIWSFVILLLFVLSVVTPLFGLTVVTLTPIHASIMKSVIAFYFGGRTIEKAVDLFRKAIK